MPSSSREPSSAKTPHIEIRLSSSSDPQGQERTLQLSRRQARAAVAALALLATFLLLGLILAVPAVWAWLDRRQYDALISERSTQGERLQSLIGALEEVGNRTATEQARIGRIHLAYGLQMPDLRVESSIEPTRLPASIYAGLVSGGYLQARTTGVEITHLGSLLRQIEQHEASDPERQRTTPSISPLGRSAFVMTSPFGTRRNPFTHQIDLHTGLDLAAATGTPILAPADGVVTFAGRYQLRVGVAWWRYGNLVTLRHDERFVTIFGHCEEVKVRRGQRVRRGDLIATVGNSGWSTNPHLHYEVRRLDEARRYRPIDPRIFILDQVWRDEEQILLQAVQELDAAEFESLPRSLRR